MSTKQTPSLRTFIANALKTTPRPRGAQARADHRYAVVQAAVTAASKGQVRKVDGGRYTAESVRTNTYRIYNELTGN